MSQGKNFRLTKVNSLFDLFDFFIFFLNIYYYVSPTEALICSNIIVYCANREYEFLVLDHSNNWVNYTGI